MSRRIKVDVFSRASIAAAIRDLEQVTRDLRKGVAQLINALTEQGVEIAKEQVRLYDAIMTGELEGNIYGVFNEDIARGVIVADSDHAAFVEFGTGVIGKGSPYPRSAPSGWQYDANNHGEKGWWYYIGNVRHWTKGMPSRPFMWSTAQRLRQMVVDEAQRHLTR